jgi:hypothetical protein
VSDSHGLVNWAVGLVGVTRPPWEVAVHRVAASTYNCANGKDNGSCALSAWFYGLESTWFQLQLMPQ